MEKKYKFEKPELEIIEFIMDDIITESFGDPDPDPNKGDVLGWW